MISCAYICLIIYIYIIYIIVLYLIIMLYFELVWKRCELRELHQV